MLVFEISDIIEINKDGIIYLDNNKDKQFIDFHECRRNWVEHVNKSGEYITWDGEPINNITDADTTCVGQRDWFSDKPFFEFFTKPFIRFEIRPKRKFREILNKQWVKRYYPQFHTIQTKIIESGWTTFDMG